MPRDTFAPKPQTTTEPLPFSSPEEAWFWFVQAYDARCSGARVVAGAGDLNRPCEPLDLLQCVDRLYRNRRILIDHVRVLAHYGRRMMAPDPTRSREALAHTLWCEAMSRLEPVLRRKGIVADPLQTALETVSA